MDQHTKRPRLAETFVYFGVTAFAKTDITITEPLPEVVKSQDIEDFLNENDRLRWKGFTGFFRSDLTKFCKAFEPMHASVGVVEEGQFMRYTDGDFTIYVYSHEKYERCGESKWSDWKNLFAGATSENYRVSKPKYSRVCTVHLSLDSDYKHLMLLPFYHDNEAE